VKRRKEPTTIGETEPGDVVRCYLGYVVVMSHAVGGRLVRPYLAEADGPDNLRGPFYVHPEEPVVEFLRGSKQHAVAAGHEVDPLRNGGTR
jgi:hypothetical protein